MNYVPVNKRAMCAIAADAPSFWDVSKWPSYWNSGAATLETSSPGKLITAPVRLLESATGATTGILNQAPKIVNRASWTLPIIGVAAAVIGGGYLAWKFKLGPFVAKKEMKP
jgi:hypothetical protein